MRAAYFLLAILSIVSAQTKQVMPQANNLVQKGERVQTLPDSTSIRLFQSLEAEIRSGSGRLVERLAGASLNLSVPGMEAGIVSANQAGAIVVEFFHQHKIQGVAFTYRGVNEGNRFATGRLSTVARGAQEVFQVYAAFTETPSGWTLSQFNIY